uniref:Uncharacterized protein n=1 Tax=Arundo donax TaxID=35708 RepID=A0A0A9R2E3_ARUDO
MNPKDQRIQRRSNFFSFATEIMPAGKEFAKNKIKEPFIARN